MEEIAVSGKLLVIAQSARMLAQLAVDAGLRPVAIDCFGDMDTEQVAIETIWVRSLALRDVEPVVSALCSKHGLTHVAYGSGFERHTETLAYLDKCFVVLGNSVEIFRRLQDKPAFFASLASLEIRYPQTVFLPPDESENWLRKPMHGEGGGDISLHRQECFVDSGQWYWQRQMHGHALSMLFVASHGQVRVLGFNRQWTIALDERHPFVFAGIINCADVPDTQRRQLLDWLNKLIAVYPLRGLASLDFILMNGDGYLLEINPRIPASAQLYGESVFSLHLKACQDGLLCDEFAHPEPKAYQIMYAGNSLVVPSAVDWPNWVVDRPHAGSIIGKGRPICSIIAAGNSAVEVEERLRQQQNIIEKLLKTGL